MPDIDTDIWKDNISTKISIVFDKLRPFQKLGVEYGINRHGRLLIGDEMGCGKTIQALSLCE